MFFKHYRVLSLFQLLSQARSKFNQFCTKIWGREVTLLASKYTSSLWGNKPVQWNYWDFFKDFKRKYAPEEVNRIGRPGVFFKISDIKNFIQFTENSNAGVSKRIYFFRIDIFLQILRSFLEQIFAIAALRGVL